MNPNTSSLESGAYKLKAVIRGACVASHIERVKKMREMEVGANRDTRFFAKMLAPVQMNCVEII